MEEKTIQRCLLLACWPAPDPLLQGLDQEPALLEVAGKSMAERAVDRAVSLGATRIDVVLGENAAPYQARLGEGERWGCEIVYHYSRAGDRPLRALARQLVHDADYLVLHADRRPPPAGPLPAATIGCREDGNALRWSGWGRLSGGVLAGCLLDAASRESLEDALLRDAGLRRIVTAENGGADRAADLLLDMRHLLRRPEPPVGIARNPVSPGIWVGNGCRVHPSARLVAPVFLGDQVFVAPGAVIGPDAVVGARSIVDRDAAIANAIVAPESYVGAAVEMNGAILAGRSLVNVSLGACLEVPDRELAGPAAAAPRRVAPGIGERLAATALWGLLWPARWLVAAVARPGIGEPAEEALRLGEPGAWLRHFRKVFHPGLAAVARGRLRIVGPAPRSAAALATLPGAWQRLHRQSLPGLLNDALLLGAEGADPAIRFAGDVLAAKKLHFRHIAGIALRYARNVWADRRPHRDRRDRQVAATGSTKHFA